MIYLKKININNYLHVIVTFYGIILMTIYIQYVTIDLIGIKTGFWMVWINTMIIRYFD